MDAELVLRGGTVVDGDGGAPFRADVGIAGDRIVAVGEGITGERSLDAGGLVVAPGLVDVHTHYDAQVFWDPHLTPSSHLGVTSVVMGNCGYSLAPLGAPDTTEMVIGTMEQVEDMNPATLGEGVPWSEIASFADYRRTIEARGSVLNLTAYVGHTTVRIATMGAEAFDRAATDDEIAAMERLVAEALDAGAVGFASSFAPTHQGWKGRPVPSRSATFDEFRRLASVVGRRGSGVVEVTLGEGMGFDEIYGLQPELGVPVTYGALLAIEGVWPILLDLHRKGIDAGADVWPQITGRPITFQMQLHAPFQFNPAEPWRLLIDQPREARLAAYRDPAWRTEAAASLTTILTPPRFDKILVAETTTRPEWIGRAVTDLADEQGGDVTPLDVMLDLALAEDLATRFTTVLFNDDEPGIAAILAEPNTALSFTDAGAHVGMVCDQMMQVEVLATWVRERGVLTLERAVQKMTAELADVWQLVDRGRVRVGGFADLMVFDPATIAVPPPQRVRDFPAGGERLTTSAPPGLAHVLVNGTEIVVDGVSVADGRRPGRWLVPGAA